MSAEAVRALLADLDDEGLAELAERLAPFLADRAPAAADELLPLAEAARRLSVHPKTAGRWARTGRLPGAVQIGKGWRIPVAALERLGEPPEPAPRPAGRPTRRAARPAARDRRGRLPLTDGPRDAGTSGGQDDRSEGATAMPEATRRDAASASVLPLRTRP